LLLGSSIASRCLVRIATRQCLRRAQRIGVRWLTRAKISSIGVALGSIIATIITNHIDSISAA